MTEAMWYSVGVDLSRIPWQIATADADGTESVAEGHPHGPTSSETASEHGDVDGIVAAVRRVAVERGAMPASIALCAGPGRSSDRLAGEVAHRLGMAASAVQLLAADSTDVRARDFVLPSALALGAARSAAAVGHVSSAGAGPAALAGTGVSLGPGGVGPAGLSLGSGAAGPSGVSLGAGAAVGSPGVPLGTLGASGSLGVPIGTGQGVGPTGQPLSGADLGGGGSSSSSSGGGGGGGGLAGKLLRLPVVVGAAVAVIVVTAVVVVATRHDTPAVAPAITPGALVTEPGAVGTTVSASTTLAATTLTPTSVEAVPTVSGTACTLGSWLADNDAYLAAMQAAALGADIEWDAVTGSLRLDISGDGAVVTTFDEWTITSTLGGAGSALTSVVGVDRNTVAFGDDGTYAVTATEIATQTKVSSGGFSIQGGPSQDSFLQGTATYTCEGNRLEVTHLAASDFGEVDLVMVFARSD